MIRIMVELCPFGEEIGKKPLGEGIIYNDLTGTKSSGNYKFALRDKNKRVWKSGTVKDFPRLKKNVWYLLMEVLKIINLNDLEKERKKYKKLRNDMKKENIVWKGEILTQKEINNLLKQIKKTTIKPYIV